MCRIRGNAPTAPRNVQVSMDICCGCAGPIPQEEDGTPGGIPCAGCCHRLCGIWCIVENAGQGPRCRHCTRMAPKVSGTPDGGARSAADNPCRHGERTFDDAFEPTLRTQSAECPCYICEKYTRFQLICKACEWLTCPMCEECFKEFHGSCVRPTEYEEEIPELHSESEQDSDKVGKYRQKSRMRGLLTLRSRHGFRNSTSASASSSSWTPPPVAPPHWIRCKICFRCKRVTKGQNERCHFCKRPCCQMCMKWMPCCETWKCNECTCLCRRDKLRTMRLKRDRARIAHLKS